MSQPPPGRAGRQGFRGSQQGGPSQCPPSPRSLKVLSYNGSYFNCGSPPFRAWHRLRPRGDSTSGFRPERLEAAPGEQPRVGHSTPAAPPRRPLPRRHRGSRRSAHARCMRHYNPQGAAVRSRRPGRHCGTAAPSSPAWPQSLSGLRVPLRGGGAARPSCSVGPSCPVGPTGPALSRGRSAGAQRARCHKHFPTAHFVTSPPPATSHLRFRPHPSAPTVPRAESWTTMVRRGEAGRPVYTRPHPGSLRATGRREAARGAAGCGAAPG